MADPVRAVTQASKKSNMSGSEQQSTEGMLNAFTKHSLEKWVLNTRGGGGSGGEQGPLDEAHEGNYSCDSQRGRT